MPRRNRDGRQAQKAKGLKRPRSWHRKHTSPEARRWEDKQRREAA